METEEKILEYGVIKCYFPLKGYGFITRPKGRDLFFYRSEICDESLIIEGVSVRFFVEKTPSGFKAKNIIRNS